AVMLHQWELEKRRSLTSHMYRRRLCSLTLKKLIVLKELDRDLNSVVIAVKIQGSKRILRSNEYVLPPSGLMETDLELTFSLQYPHFLKRDANRLQIMLQRRKRYKNRTILGYKTLAVGVINMAEVMQHPTDGGQILGLHSNVKEAPVRAAELSVYSLSSQPIDPEDGSGQPGAKAKASGELTETGKPARASVFFLLLQQPNFKQKFVALLKRFKVSDEVLDSDPVDQTHEVEEDLDLLYDSIEVYNQSDSGPEMEDNESVLSTPKPKLKPFFEGMSHSSSQTEIGSLHSQKSQPREQPAHVSPELRLCAQSHHHSPGAPCCSVSESCVTPPIPIGFNGKTEQLSITFLFQYAVILPPLYKSSRCFSLQYLNEILHEHNQPIVSTISAADVQAAFNTIVTRIQRFCNCNAQTPPTIKVAVAGDQTYLSTVLRCFVEQLANKTPDWLSYIWFLVIPVGCHPVAKYISSFDSKFNTIFLDAGWRDVFGRLEAPTSDNIDVAGRVSQYLAGANTSHQFPISEAMLTYKQKRYSCVCVCVCVFLSVLLLDSDDAMMMGSINMLSSPPAQTGVPHSKDITCTPPSSPSVSPGAGGEVMGLQVDYWTCQGAEKKKEGEKRDVGIKNTLKSNFRSLQVSRIPSGGELTPPPGMSMTVVMKEKNKKGMLKSVKKKKKKKKKNADFSLFSLSLWCLVSIDGVEWHDVKFFQLAAQWPTHVKHFPVGIFGYTKPM
uniref:Si:ch211-126j24.1 n=1 Tax=Astyanax mexicanus TaxID=7994 RepID=A0A8B9JTX9_ASTMX